MASKRTGAAGFSFGQFLELLGQPIYWFLLVCGFALLRLWQLLIKTIKLASRLLFSLVFIGLTIIGTAIFFFLKLIVFVFQSIRLPRIKFSFPQIRLKIKVPKIRFSFKFFLVLILLFSIAVGTTWSYLSILKDLPQPDRLISRDQAVSTKIYDRRGQLLYKIYRNQNRSLVRIADLPPYLIQATVAIEDAEFYHHYGFSLKGIFRSVMKNLAEGKLQGGSTITQQLVKNALLTPERTIIRKMKELVLSVQTEMRFNKEEILQMYLNEVGYGGAAYGAEEAAWKYFGKSARNLTLAEAALLAGLPASPTLYSPFGANPELATQRQAQVLQRMMAEGFITPEQAAQATATKLEFAPQTTDIRAPHFVMYVKNFLVQKYGEQLVEEGGLEVVTSLDLELQTLVEKIVHEEVMALKNLNVGNAAALVTNPKTGEVLAMVGSHDYFNTEQDGNVNVTLRPRQPGSAIKPINYATALSIGYTPATILSDTPITYQIPGQEPYSPRNYDNRFHGNISLRTALASSYNVPAVKVLSSYGVERMIEMGRKLGITTWEDKNRFGLALTLGGGEVKMTDLAVAYGTFANLGLKVNLNPILKIKDYQEETYSELECPRQNGFPEGIVVEAAEDHFCQPEEVLDPKIAYLLNDILADNQARAPAFGSHSLLYLPDKTVAVKTGTTNNLRDNWTIGYTPNLLVATWVGNNDNSPMSYIASGLTGASSIWNKTITAFLKNRLNDPFPRPEGIIEVDICSLTGTLPCQGCPTKKELFIRGTEPTQHCRMEPPKDENQEREKILGKSTTAAPHQVIEYQRPKEGEVIWERIRR